MTFEYFIKNSDNEEVLRFFVDEADLIKIVKYIKNLEIEKEEYC